MTELPTEFVCPECDEEMAEEDEGMFFCANCDLGLEFYLENGRLYADEY